MYEGGGYMWPFGKSKQDKQTEQVLDPRELIEETINEMLTDGEITVEQLETAQRKGADDTGAQLASGSRQVKEVVKELTQWWETTFTKQQKTYIESKLGKGWIRSAYSQSTKKPPCGALPIVNAAILFKEVSDTQIASSMFKQAINQAQKFGSVIDLHFVYSNMIPFLYSKRNKEADALELTADACKNMIALGPKVIEAWKQEYPMDTELPGHRGFDRLPMIYANQGDFDNAIRICELAKDQGWGWAGNWDKDIIKYRKKQAKA
jgi:hypothetical protein